jgi:hypothetical protein
MTESAKKDAAQGFKGGERTPDTSHISEYHFFVSSNGMNGDAAAGERSKTHELYGEGTLEEQDPDFKLPK